MTFPAVRDGWLTLANLLLTTSSDVIEITVDVVVATVGVAIKVERWELETTAPARGVSGVCVPQRLFRATLGDALDGWEGWRIGIRSGRTVGGFLRVKAGRWRVVAVHAVDENVFELLPNDRPSVFTRVDGLGELAIEEQIL